MLAVVAVVAENNDASAVITVDGSYWERCSRRDMVQSEVGNAVLSPSAMTVKVGVFQRFPTSGLGGVAGFAFGLTAGAAGAGGTTGAEAAAVAYERGCGATMTGGSG